MKRKTDLTNEEPFQNKVWEIVKKIPPGQVLTYGQVARLAGHHKAARAVGNILHKNPDPVQIPCHRVVDRRGCLAKNFAFGGLGGQTRLLQKEGVKDIDGKIDLAKYLFRYR